MTIKTENNALPKGFSLQRNLHVFGVLWLVTAIIYIPVAKAGWMIDAIGWIHDMKHHSFLDFINRTYSGSESFYQLFAIHYYVCYKLWGMNMWMWSLFYMSVHAMNATLLFIVCRNIFRDAGIQKGALITFCGALLYVVCPHISEVVVWKACFHYLMGVAFILFSLLMIQKYQRRQRSIYVWSALLVFCLSAFGLEIFYLTPFLCFILALYYRLALGYDKRIFRKTICWFFIPQLLLFGLYFAGLYAVYKFMQPHGNNIYGQLTAYLAKPPKYIFHILFFGRYFPREARNQVYHFCDSIFGISVFYSLCALILLYAAFRFRRMAAEGKTLLLLFAWIVCSLGLTLPLWLPQDGLVSYDRYTYEPDAFIYMFLALLIYNMAGRKVFTAIIALYVLVNLGFTYKVNTYWKQSSGVVNNLVNTFPNDPSKTVLLLDLPDRMKGVGMILATDYGQFKMMYNVMRPDQINNPVYDVEAFYSQGPGDGAHVNVLDDSTIRVTLNEWGTFWLYYDMGSGSYENKDFKVNMIDEGHMYELVFRHPASGYLLLYQTGGQWKIADMEKKNVDQF